MAENSSVFTNLAAKGKNNNNYCIVTLLSLRYIFRCHVLLFRCGETTPKEEIYHAFSIDLPSL